jgi:hypothetical protein
MQTESNGQGQESLASTSGSVPDLNEINAFLTRMYKNPSRLALTGATCAMMLAEQGKLEELRRMIGQSLTYERGSVDETIKSLKAQNAQFTAGMRRAADIATETEDAARKIGENISAEYVGKAVRRILEAEERECETIQIATDVRGAHSLQRPCSVACPVCKQAARWGYREEQDEDTNTVYAYLECPACGLRSREVISLKPEREALEKEWPLNADLTRVRHLCH